MERKANARPHNSVKELKVAVDLEWNKMSADFVVRTCKSFWPHLKAMLVAKGGRFET